MKKYELEDLILSGDTDCKPNRGICVRFAYNVSVNGWKIGDNDNKY